MDPADPLRPHVTSGAYGATFYTLIGLHALHVLGALVWLGVALRLAARGRFLDGRAGILRACAIYWHFVVGLWPILYVAVYLDMTRLLAVARGRRGAGGGALAPRLAAACATCVSSAYGDRGFNWAYLLLILVMPFVVLWRHRRHPGAGAPATDPVAQLAHGRSPHPHRSEETT